MTRQTGKEASGPTPTTSHVEDTFWAQRRCDPTDQVILSLSYDRRVYDFIEVEELAGAFVDSRLIVDFLLP